MAIGEPPVIPKEETPDPALALGSDDSSSLDSVLDDSSAPTSDPAIVHSDDMTEGSLSWDAQLDRWHVFMIVYQIVLDSIESVFLALLRASTSICLLPLNQVLFYFRMRSLWDFSSQSQDEYT